MSTRINKYLAEHGYCSRREADGLIRAGSVFINRKRAELGDRVEEGDKVSVLGHRRKAVAPDKVYLMLNKPPGYATTTDWRKKDTVMSLVPAKDRVFPVGRLETEACGLILLSNDGDLAFKLTHPSYEREEEYEVGLDKPISDAHLGHLLQDAAKDDPSAEPLEIKRFRNNMFSLVLRDGRANHIRRLCDALGYTVTYLCRVRVQKVRLGDMLPPGKSRPLSESEVASLKDLRERSEKAPA